jgi:hypothetical protein
MERFAVRSSLILSIGYNPFEQILEVELKGGNLYQYYHVPQDVYNSFMRAASKGKFFDSYIKGHYSYRKLDYF